MRRRWLMERYLSVLPQALTPPADSYEEVARRMAQTLKYNVGVSTVSMVFGYVRKNAVELGFTVPYSKRGPNPYMFNRFTIVPVLPDGTKLSSDEERMTDEGIVAALTTVMTMQKNSKSMLEAIALHLHGRKKPRALNGIARNCGNHAENIADALEELREANGS